MTKVKFTKEDMIGRAEEYLKEYNKEWDGYDEALLFAEDGNTLAKMIIEYFKEN